MQCLLFMFLCAAYAPTLHIHTYMQHANTMLKKALPIFMVSKFEHSEL